MAAWRVCGLVALAHLVPATSNDDGALVQSHVGLHRQEPHAATPEELVASCADLLLLEGTPEKVTADTKKLADSVMAAFRDDKFVWTINKAVRNVTKLWGLFKELTAFRIGKLDATPANFTKDEAFQRIYSFWVMHGMDLSRAVAAEAAARWMVESALPEGYLLELHPPAKEGPDAVFKYTFDYVYKRVDDVLDGVLSGVSADNAPVVCERIGMLLGNLSNTYFTLPMAVKADKRAPNPELESVATKFEPEGAVQLLKYLNATYAMASNVTLLLEGIVRDVKKANAKHLAHRWKC